LDGVADPYQRHRGVARALAAARSTKDIGKARGLEEEIARAESQRDRLLAHITTNLVTADPPPATRQKGGEPAAASTTEPMAAEIAPAVEAAVEPEQPAAAAANTLPAEAEPRPEEAAQAAALPEEEAAVSDATAPDEEAPPALATDNSTEQLSPETADRVVATGAAPPAPAPQAASAEGGKNMWDQLNPGDIERAKQEIETRRAEMLARHAEELRGLEADQAQLDTLEQAIAAFLQKFSGPPGGGVVKLDAERELRQTAG